MVTSKSVALITPNLAVLGVPRRAPIGTADLETIWLTPYPVITNYIAFCHYMGIAPFTGGTRGQPGGMGNGHISSGYRNELINNNKNSPHRFAFALDIIFLTNLIQAARAANLYFNRVGIYPHQKFIHVDLAPDLWIKHYHKKRYWICIDNQYKYYDSFIDAITAAEYAYNGIN